MSTGKPENVTPGAPPKKWARHLLVLLGIVLLVFVFDSLVFGSVPLSLKQFQWSACDLVISFLLGACALQAYLLKRKSPEARTEKEEKENGNGKPPAKTMSNINRELDRVSQQGAKQVEAVLRKFEGVPGALDALSYNLVIRAHAKEGNHKRAGEWIMRMEERGIKATVCSYNTQLDACAKAQNAEACERWLQRMLDQDLQPNVISFATVIHVFARRGDAERARRSSWAWWPPCPWRAPSSRGPWRFCGTSCGTSTLGALMPGASSRRWGRKGPTSRSTTSRAACGACCPQLLGGRWRTWPCSTAACALGACSASRSSSSSASGTWRLRRAKWWSSWSPRRV
ncbi:unnamed protein product [Effrenium voratum]|nr:unnamed protein product [Effrenium voratum]